MSADIIQADYERLDGIASQFSSRAEHVFQLEQTLRSRLEALRQGGWIGVTASAFYDEMAGEVLPALARLAQALQTAQAVTLQIKATFQQAEEEAAALFGKTIRDYGKVSQKGEAATYEPIGILRQKLEQAIAALSQTGDETLTTPERIAQLLGIVATILDITALGISTTGSIIEVLFAALGIAFPLPAGDELIGFSAGVALYNTVLNPIENNLGLASLSLVATADVLTGATNWEQVELFPGQLSTELVLGPDTTLCLLSIALGNTPATPEAMSDTAANAGVVYYDIQRLRNQEPFWGLAQLRIGRTANGSYYFRVTDEKGQPMLQDIWGEAPTFQFE
ncbi:MAG: WXG100 family type VII secretion target [Anaerolineales bacterium]|nr:WXG100 family type VII secretion target [Anaerolineales bacterium]